MGYLRSWDYDKSVQKALLDQLTGSLDNRRVLTESPVVGEIKAYLSQKYWLGTEFNDTNPYSFTATYTPGQRAELNFPAYSATSAYALNSLVVVPGTVPALAYICTSAISSPGETFNPAHWALLGNQYDIFNLLYPHALFNLQNIYAVGDEVYWKGKTYTCLQDTVIQGHEGELQQGRNSDYMNGIINVFPDDKINGATNWGTGVAYTVPAGTLPTDDTYWQLGDNRNAQLVEAAVFMSLYRLNARIAPANVNEEVKLRFKMSIELLEMAAKGEIQFDLPVLQITQGRMTRFGSNVKTINVY